MGAAGGEGELVKDESISIRQPCPPFCWQNKIVLKVIRDRTAETMLPNSLLVYFVLTELASDEHAAEDFRAKHADVVKKCGLSRRTIILRLQDLERIGVISVFPNYGPDRRQLPSSIRLHTPEELSANGGGGCNHCTGEGANAPHTRCTPSLIRKNEEEEDPLTPLKGEASHFQVVSLEEARAYAIEIGQSIESAERFHRMNAAGDWRDKTGKKIGNWRKAFLAFAKKDAAPEPGGRHAAPRREKRKTFFHVDHSKGF